MPEAIPFVLAATRHGSMIVNRLDRTRLEDRGHAFGVGGDILANGAFQPNDVATLLNLLALRRRHFGEGVVALDVGANIGVHTIEWARAMDGWGRVLAVEPQPRVFYALAGNIALNNCFNADALHAACTAEPGEVRVPLLDHRSHASFGSLPLRPSSNVADVGQTVDYSQAATAAVAGVPIDRLGLARLDLLKVDVEGMEAEVLQGAASTLASCRPAIFVEYVYAGWDRLADVLEPLGYLFFRSGMDMLAMHRDDPGRSSITQA